MERHDPHETLGSGVESDVEVGFIDGNPKHTRAALNTGARAKYKFLSVDEL